MSASLKIFQFALLLLSLASHVSVVGCPQHGDVTQGDGGESAVAVLRRLVGGVERFNSMFPQEKVYLHFDNTSYFEGETMWFAAYVVRADRGTLTDMSKVLYVELLDPMGEVVQTKKLHVAEGRASGSFQLDHLLTSGYYEVRAYTRYMLNWDDGWIFSRVFPVFQQPSHPDDYTSPSLQSQSERLIYSNPLAPRKINVGFYPEGGRLVEGIPTRVAFCATDGSGLPLDTHGYLLMPNGDSIAVQSMYEGRGVFDYTPQSVPATLALAVGHGKVETFELPQSEREGYVLNVCSSSASHIDVFVKRSINGEDTLALALVNGGNVEATTILWPGQRECRLRFDKEKMSPGVSQFALLSVAKGIEAERMVFVHPKEFVDTMAVEAKGKLAPCSSVSLNFQTIPNATFSLAVRDANAMNCGHQSDVATWLLLASDLRGYISNPQHYFESDDEKHRLDADLLMMVQGWRRYDIANMSPEAKSVGDHPLEDALYVFGKLHGKKNVSMEGISLTATLYNAAGQSLNGKATTDSTGRYAFRLPDCEGEWTLLMNAQRGHKAANVKVCIDRCISPLPRKFSPLELQAEPLSNYQLAKVIEHEPTDKDDTLGIDTRTHHLREVKVSGRRRFANPRAKWENEQQGAWKAYVRYDCDKAAEEYYDHGEETPSILEWLAMKDHNFNGSTIHMDDLYEAIRDNPVAEYNSDEMNKVRTSFYGDATTMYTSADQERVDPEKAEILDYHVLNLQRMGLSYKNRPIVWILNNAFYCVSMAPSTITKADYVDIVHINNEHMPSSLGDYKAAYITEDDQMWRRYVRVPKLDNYKPVTVFLYSHQGRPTQLRGQRRTYFQGYSHVEQFQMPCQGAMPRQTDHIRTLYWAPTIQADGSGRASVTFQNSHSCSLLSISAEGITNHGHAVTGCWLTRPH